MMARAREVLALLFKSSKCEPNYDELRTICGEMKKEIEEINQRCDCVVGSTCKWRGVSCDARN